MLCKDKVANLDFMSKKNNAKHKNLFGLKAAQSDLCVKLESSNYRELLFNFCKTRSIEN